MKGIQVGYMRGPVFERSGWFVRPTSAPQLLASGQAVTYGGAAAVVCIQDTRHYTYFELRCMIDGLGEAP